MAKAGGIIALIAGVFGVIAAAITLIIGKVVAAVAQADAAAALAMTTNGTAALFGARRADGVIWLGWSGPFFSLLTIVLGAVAMEGHGRGPTPGILLIFGEVGLFAAAASLIESRAHRYSTGASVRVARGVRFGGRQYHSRRAEEVVDGGAVAVTTRRVAFVGASIEVRYTDLINTEFQPGFTGIMIHTRRRQTPDVMSFAGAGRASLLIALMSSGTFADNRLPPGLVLTARPNGKGWIDFDARTTG